MCLGLVPVASQTKSTRGSGLRSRSQLLFVIVILPFCLSNSCVQFEIAFVVLVLTPLGWRLGCPFHNMQYSITITVEDICRSCMRILYKSMFIACAMIMRRMLYKELCYQHDRGHSAGANLCLLYAYWLSSWFPPISVLS